MSSMTPTPEKDLDLLKLLEANKKNVEYLKAFLESELSMPNIPMSTKGGEVFWTDLAEYRGWKIQQNMLTKHARILNPKSERIAWGTVNGMNKAFQRFVQKYKKPNSSQEVSNAMDELVKLKGLLDLGIISDKEFLEKKNKLLELI